MENLEYYSQLGQDKLVDELLGKKQNGVFVDIGAVDGVKISNTYFFEKFRNWTGICVEPQKNEYDLLVKNRKSINLNCGVFDYNGEAEFLYVDSDANMYSGVKESMDEKTLSRIYREVRPDVLKTITINVRRLQDILDEYNIYDIDYCSIDTEGSELNVVKSIDFNKTNIKILTIENNWQDTSVIEYLKTKGYILHSKIKYEDVFVKQNS